MYLRYNTLPCRPSYRSAMQFSIPIRIFSISSFFFSIFEKSSSSFAMAVDRSVCPLPFGISEYSTGLAPCISSRSPLSCSSNNRYFRLAFRYWFRYSFFCSFSVNLLVLLFVVMRPVLLPELRIKFIYPILVCLDLLCVKHITTGKTLPCPVDHVIHTAGVCYFCCSVAF